MIGVFNLNYVTFLLYQENFPSFDNMCSRINQLGVPCILSPLHTPLTGKKPHYHLVVDNTEADKPISFFDDIMSDFNTPQYKRVLNIHQMELYLTHSTLDSRSKQQFSKADKELKYYDQL